MTLYYKNQLYGNKVFTKDLSTSVIDLYKYTVKDYQASLIDDYIPVLKIDSSKKISIRDGVLSVDGYRLKLYNILIGDVIFFLQSVVGIDSCYILSSNGGSEEEGAYNDELCNVPAIMLSNCCNYSTQTLSGDISPIELAMTADITNIFKLDDSKISDITVYDFIKNKKIDYELTDNGIYFDPSVNTSVYLTKNCSSYILFIDTKIKQLTEGILINYGLTSSDLINAPLVWFPQAINGSISSSSFTITTQVRISIPAGVILGDDWIAISNGFGTTSGVVTSLDIQNGYVSTGFDAIQGGTLDVSATFSNTYTSTATGRGIVNLATSSDDCANATNLFSVDNWSFDVEAGGKDISVYTSYTDVNGDISHDSIILEGIYSPQSLIEYLQTLTYLTISGIAEDYSYIDINNASFHNVRLSITTVDTPWDVSQYVDGSNYPLNPTFHQITGPTSGVEVCLSADTSGFEISCAGASNQVAWGSNYYMREYIEGVVNFTMEINGVQYGDQHMIDTQSFPGYVFEDAVNWYNTNYGANLNVNSDGVIYSITAEDTNTYRIKFFTDGAELFNVAQTSVDNPTYEELPGRIGFQVCVVGVG